MPFIRSNLSLLLHIAIALFRALLSQSRAAPLSETERDGLQHLIRNKFRYNMYLTSWRLLRLAFTAGYEVSSESKATLN